MNSSYPLWVEKVGRQSGRDHLGIESVGQAILEELTFGISNITRRICYYSFFCYVIKSFFESKEEKTYKNYNLHLKKLSLLYALSMSSAHEVESNTGIDGIEYARKYLKQIYSGEKIIDDQYFSIEGTAREFLNNNWIYKAKLNNLNLTYAKDNSLIPSLVEPYGRKLAQLFEDKLKDLLPQNIEFNKLTPEMMKKLEEQWCYHRVKDHEKERKLLEDIIFSRSFDNQVQLNRRYSLTLILQFVKESSEKDLSKFERWIYQDDNLPEKLTHIKYLWKILYARNYFVYSLESLFLYFLMQIQKKPLSLDTFLQQTEKVIYEQASNKDSSDVKIAHIYNKPLIHVLNEIFENEKINSDLYEPNLIYPLTRNRSEISQENEHQYLSNAILCLLSLYYRYRFKPEIPFTEDMLLFFNFGDTFRLSLRSFFDTLDDALHEGRTLKEVVNELYTTQLLPRHQLIATEKLYANNLDTFHFQLEDNLYHFVKRPEHFIPSFNALKFSEAINFLEDLDLLHSEDRFTYELTQKGKDVLEEFYE